MSLHDRLLDVLQSCAKVRLVASLRDERLGFPDASDLRIFVPDLHLITEKRRKAGGYKYATNHPDLLATVIKGFRDLKCSADKEETVVVYQVGDFLDLWRETADPDARLDAAAHIRDDHEGLIEALLHDKLKARFLLGNHDFELHLLEDYVAWERRYFLPDRLLTSPSVIVLHGDIFDWVEKMNDTVQRVFVYLFAPHLSPNDYALGDMEKLIRTSHGTKKYLKGIQFTSGSCHVGSLRELDGGPVPDRWNVKVKGLADVESLKFLDKAHDLCQKANEDYGLALSVAVIGHTHHARIAVREEDGNFFTLIDCGAWIENCSEGVAGPAMPSAQIAALSANDARIYQLLV